MPNLSAIILTHNEKDNLKQLLPALTWVDELVVVDSGSVDGSCEIARRAGARVIVNKFTDFASQRNLGLHYARGAWVLYLDADERPGPDFDRTVLEAIKTRFYNAYRVPIRSNIFGRFCRFGGTQHDAPIRLFRRELGTWQTGVHERVNVQPPIGRLQTYLKHYTTQTLEQYLRKLHLYTELAVKERLENRAKSPAVYKLVLMPLMELFRRLAWHGGVLDGPQGWLFCALSAVDVWFTLYKHRKLVRNGY